MFFSMKLLPLALVAAYFWLAAEAYLPPGGSYQLTSFGRYHPAPTQTFPGRNQGAPDWYKREKFKRSADEEHIREEDDVASLREHDKLVRETRGVKIIHPIYRPPPQPVTPPKTYSI